jgi:hypothetical protein
MTRDQNPELPPMAPGDRPQDPWLDGRDMRFEGYRIKTLEQGGEYPDTMSRRSRSPMPKAARRSTCRCRGTVESFAAPGLSMHSNDVAQYKL